MYQTTRRVLSLCVLPQFNCSAPRLNDRGYSLETSNRDYDPPLLDMLTKHYRRFHLDQPIIEFRKVVLPVKRMRTIDDHLEAMKAKMEVPAVINQREEFPDVDVVFDHFQISAMKRRVNSNVAPVYVRLPTGEDIRCVLQKLDKHYIDNWLVKVHLNRYIVGRPNLLFIPFQMEHSFRNPFLNRGSIPTTTLFGAWIYCYNETYPGQLLIDTTNVSPARPFKMGDLQNTLPDGMVLHERYAKLMHRNIVTLTIDQERKLMDSIRSQERLSEDPTKRVVRKAVAGENQAELDEIDEFDNPTPQPKKEKKEPKGKKYVRKSMIFKQSVLKANQELKKEMETLEKDAKAKK